MSGKTLWISCDIKPLITPKSFIWNDYASNRVLTWNPRVGYQFSFWDSSVGWIDSDDSLCKLPDQPICWIPIDSIMNDWINIKTEIPKENGQYLAYYEDLSEKTIMVLLKFKDGKWFYDSNNTEIDKPYRPLLWMHPPKVQKSSNTPTVGVYE